MKSIIKETEVQQKSEYPCLKIFQETQYEGNYDKIVMFTSENTGTVVSAIGDYALLGEYSRIWEECKFEPFTGTIELSN